MEAFQSKVEEPNIAPFNAWLEEKKTLTDKEILGPEPSGRGEYLRLHRGEISFAVFPEPGMLVRRERPFFLLIPGLFSCLLFSPDLHHLELEDF